jgi:hypothetical protein
VGQGAGDSPSVAMQWFIDACSVLWLGSVVLVLLLPLTCDYFPPETNDEFILIIPSPPTLRLSYMHTGAILIMYLFSLFLADS